MAWSNVSIFAGTGSAIGTGETNSATIIAQAGHISSSAQECLDYSVHIGGVITDGAYCWQNNDISNKNPYGALYNWYAMDHASELAPTGCHLPTKAEYDTLRAFLATVIGGKMKEAGCGVHWACPNTGATNSSKFTAISGGSRSGGDGLFKGFGSITYFWTTDKYMEALSYLDDGLGEFGPGSENYGVSVRCIVD